MSRSCGPLPSLLWAPGCSLSIRLSLRVPPSDSFVAENIQRGKKTHSVGAAGREGGKKNKKQLAENGREPHKLWTAVRCYFSAAVSLNRKWLDLFIFFMMLSLTLKTFSVFFLFICQSPCLLSVLGLIPFLNFLPPTPEALWHSG